MGPEPARLFAILFLAHKEADWVKSECKFGTINLRKINNSFQFTDDLLSLNDGGTFEKHKDIYPAELELKKKNNGNSLSSFLDLYIYIGNGEFNTRLFEYYHFTTLYVPRKLFLWEQSFLEFLEQQVKLKIFLIIVNGC